MSQSTTPSEIHPEHDNPTPENIDDWSDEQLNEYRRVKEDELQEDARDHRQQLSEDQEKALAALEDPERDQTAEVELGQATVPVKTYLNGRMERKWQRIEKNVDDPDAVVDTMVDLLCWLIEDEDYTDPELWYAYREEYGTARLSLSVVHALEPFLDEQENDQAVQKFREAGR